MNEHDYLAQYAALTTDIQALQRQAQAVKAMAIVQAKSRINTLMQLSGLTLPELEKKVPLKRAPWGSKSRNGVRAIIKA